MMGQHAHPEVSMHTHPLSEYMDFIYKDDWKGVASLMVSSAGKLEKAGAKIFYGHDPEFWAQMPQAPREVSLSALETKGRRP